ncbi:MAG: ABC transporter ATP-binding protein [Bifidobacteriaceae bacterium]|jgi:peptide/nickel transport system ATP-binding protein|nr:ABC transporter ATP-binding protein [Bifidobacteriaceae bacterium]
MAYVEVRGLTVAIGDGSLIVDDASLDLEAGQVLGVVGESGSGKSTLALALLAYARQGAHITAGQVVVGGTDMLKLTGRPLRLARGGTVAYVPQDPATALNPKLSIEHQISEVLTEPLKERPAIVQAALESVGLPSTREFSRRHPAALSGGQQQRVALAMAIAPGPGLLVLDEPTTGLDVTTQARVLELVDNLCQQRQMAAIYISHDLAVVADVADRIAVMYGGQFVEVGEAEQVTTAPRHPYTRALIDAVPSVRRRLRLSAIPGRAAELSPKRQGCVFYERCALAQERCQTDAIGLADYPDGGQVRCILSTPPPAAPRVIVDEAEPAADQKEAALLVKNLAAGYGHTQVLHDVSFAVGPGECVALVGESGSGKTTLARCLIGLHERQAGEVLVFGDYLEPLARQRTPEQRRDIQYIFQNPYASLNPRRTVGDSIGVAVKFLGGVSGKAVQAEVNAALERVELPAALAGRYPAELSGGQRQRAAIARALVCHPKVLLCDEVTSALDVSVQASVIELLRGLLEDGLSMLFVTHNLAVVRSIAHRADVLEKGRIVESALVEQLFATPEHPYTQQLLANTLELADPAGGE